MELPIAGGISRLLKVSLLPLAPFQSRFDPPSPVHGWLLERALQIMYEDGMSEAAHFFSSFQPDLRRGLIWADQDWKNLTHYCQMEHKFRPGAALEAERYYHRAIQSFANDVHKTFFYLGAALHIIQDMAVPHHAAGVLRDGHQAFERWVLDHWDTLPTASSPCYRAYRKPADWVRHCADLAAPYFPLVSFSHGANQASFAEAARYLVPLSVRGSAGFLLMAHGALCLTAPYPERSFVATGSNCVNA